MTAKKQSENKNFDMFYKKWEFPILCTENEELMNNIPEKLKQMVLPVKQATAALAPSSRNKNHLILRLLWFSLTTIRYLFVYPCTILNPNNSNKTKRYNGLSYLFSWINCSVYLDHATMIYLIQMIPYSDTLIVGGAMWASRPTMTHEGVNAASFQDIS